VADPEACQALVDATMAEFGRVDILVNNAGMGTAVPATRETPEQFRGVVDVNLNGAYWMAQACGRVMKPGSSIINISSVLGLTTAGLPQAAYAASKAGVNGMTLPIARELARFGIRVMTIAPGIFDTPMLQGMSEELRASLGQQVPFPPRLGRPEEYAALVKHVIENEVLNGEVIRLDGAIRMAPK
ncbi:MAG: SDR family oxidoreductase, partial [Usitatibacter sp.]